MGRKDRPVTIDDPRANRSSRVAHPAQLNWDPCADGTRDPHRKDRPMGRQALIDMLRQNPDRRAAMLWHLTENHYPPYPASPLLAAEVAIFACQMGDRPTGRSRRAQEAWKWVGYGLLVAVAVRLLLYL